MVYLREQRDDAHLIKLDAASEFAAKRQFISPPTSFSHGDFDKPSTGAVAPDSGHRSWAAAIERILTFRRFPRLQSTGFFPG